MRLTVGAVGLFNMILGFGFLFRPARLAEPFALLPLGAQGLATLRADFAAFFLTGAVFALIGAWRAGPPVLLVPLMLLGTALTGRAVGIAANGVGPQTFAPMIAEALMIAILLLARRVFASATV